MPESNDNLLWMNLPEISEETAEQLGERAHCFVDLYNDWLDIWGSFSSAYSKDLPFSSLVAADFFGLGKDLHWLHRLLHWGNYPLITRILRYDWELMFRAYYADVYQPSIPGDADLPGSSVDDKVQWLDARGPGLHFNSLIVPILNVVLASGERDHFTRIWRNLNHHIHPTKHLRYRMLDESVLAIRDSFDKEWAAEAVGISCDVFDLIWLMTLKRLPKCVPLLTGQRLFLHTPRTSRLLFEPPRI